jgi:imidazoleglycerol-phosphate dehydratase
VAGVDRFFADRVVRVKSRRAKLHRRTAETDIQAELNLDGQGRYQISTGIRFLDHMLELFARHGGFDLSVSAKGDLDVDQHHTVEDVGLVLGEILRQALGDKKGINRAGYFVMPMDETLGLAAVDLSGRPYLVMKGSLKARQVGDLKTELLEDFFQGFVSSARANLHLKVAYGRSSHHAVESLFKAFARALRYACSHDTRLKQQLPSTKGLL